MRRLSYLYYNNASGSNETIRHNIGYDGIIKNVRMHLIVYTGADSIWATFGKGSFLAPNVLLGPTGNGVALATKNDRFEMLANTDQNASNNSGDPENFWLTKHFRKKTMRVKKGDILTLMTRHVSAETATYLLVLEYDIVPDMYAKFSRRFEMTLTTAGQDLAAARSDVVHAYMIPYHCKIKKVDIHGTIVGDAANDPAVHIGIFRIPSQQYNAGSPQITTVSGDLWGRTLGTRNAYDDGNVMLIHQTGHEAGEADIFEAEELGEWEFQAGDVVAVAYLEDVAPSSCKMSLELEGIMLKQERGRAVYYEGNFLEDLSEVSD